jgi:hypothetical protein
VFFFEGMGAKIEIILRAKQHVHEHVGVSVVSGVFGARHTLYTARQPEDDGLPAREACIASLSVAYQRQQHSTQLCHLYISR